MQPVYENSVLYIQNAPHRAGAQTCLARLLEQKDIRRWNPAVLCSAEGWLTRECARLGVPCLVVPFPRSRSLLARLHSNDAFAAEVRRALDDRSINPAIVHANDHWEGVLGIKLANALNARSAIFLRTSRLTRDQYFKYRCNEYDFIAAVGEPLRVSARRWDDANSVALIHDGIGGDEFLAPKAKPNQAPEKILVIGATRSSKGWADLVEALAILERDDRPRPRFVDFTGGMPKRTENYLPLERLRTTQCRFLGRVDYFRELVRDYDLVVNPSRSDSFGMAAVEVLAAGVPLLSSRVGVIEQVMGQDFTLFPPSDPASLARALGNVLERWNEVDFGIAEARAALRNKFPIEATAAELDRQYRQLVGAAPTNGAEK